MKLWHLHSATLKGFYASEVYVAAPNQGAAQELAFDAFLDYLDGCIEDMGFVPGHSLYEDDDDFAEQRQELVEAFNAELSNLKEVPGGAAIFRRE